MLAAIKKEPKRTAPGCPALFSAPSAPFNRRRCRSRPRACGAGADCLCIHACLRTMFSTFSTWFSTVFLLPSSCLGPGCGKLISCIGPHINFSTYGPIVDFGGFSRRNVENSRENMSPFGRFHYKIFSNVAKSLLSTSLNASITPSSARRDSSRQRCSSAVESCSIAEVTARVW